MKSLADLAGAVSALALLLLAAWGADPPIAANRDWAAAQESLGCERPQWQHTPRGIVLYGLPNDFSWELRFACSDGRIEVTGPLALNDQAVEQAYLVFRTTSGIETRALRRTEYGLREGSYWAAPGDALVEALARGEAVRLRFTYWPQMAIDGRRAAPYLRPLLARCGWPVAGPSGQFS
jgi:hypothetical protein